VGISFKIPIIVIALAIVAMSSCVNFSGSLYAGCLSKKAAEKTVQLFKNVGENCNTCKGKGKISTSCPACGGTGKKSWAR